MSALSTAAPIRDVDDLVRLLGVPYNAEQRAAIVAPLEPGVIVAGAGSGKTTVMAARVVWLVGTGQVPADAVLGLTFTTKAAGELNQRIRRALTTAGLGVPTAADLAAGDDPGEPTVSTYHSFAAQLIEEHGLRLGVEPHARLLADASRYQLAARVICRARGPFPALEKSVPDLVVDLLALEGELSEHLVDVDELRAHDRDLLRRLDGVKGCETPSNSVCKALVAARRRLEFVDLVEAYRAEKAERDLVDFGDQMAFAARLAEQCPPAGAALRERFRVVLLDEYQDTSVAQRRMLVGLFGGGHPVTAVGDPCQAIYAWRGASVANLEDFPHHFPIPGSDGSSAAARRYSLRENRRSGQLVLDLANGLAAPLRALHAGVEALTPSADNVGRGEIRTALLDTYAEEIHWIGGQVAAAIAEGTEPGEVAVLVRATRDIGPVHAELVSRDIPVEVVGLGGLVHLPEVADVIAVLEVLDEATANAALVRLLAGPRWRIGPRDLALLGRRARDLVAVPRDDTRSSLEAAVPITDPAELVSLSDAMSWPGDLGYSDAARSRFQTLDAEIAELRRHVGEPLLDLLHRVIAVTGLDVEIAAGPHAVASRRRESLAAFLDVAASFSDLDGDSSVAAFLAYLRAAEEHERGLDSATPGTANSVKLMTAHKAKGLEWDVVVLPDLTRSVFPSNQGRAKWTSRGDSLPFALRGDRDALPAPVELSSKGIDAFEKAVKEQAQLEERRLGYVAFTRPRRRLVASAHWWGPTQKKPRGPSEYLLAARAFCTDRNLDPGGPWAEEPAAGAENPLRGVVVEYPWPAPLDPAAYARRRAGAKLVRAALRDPERRTLVPAGLSPSEAETVAGWDRDLDLLLTELARTRSAVREVELPSSLSASQVLSLAADPDSLARDLARPMPRRPAPAARRGTRFHGWVEALFGQQPLLDPEDLPGAADALVDDADLAALQKAFLRSPYADRRPYRIEAPFALAIGGRVVRGRIDAVYELLDGYEVVDWKTSKSASADPLQLAIYRLAWAEIAGVDPEQVSAAFLYVRAGRVVRPELPTREQVEEILAGPGAFPAG
ncbi:MAG TPA: ATP-dependent DNA helicase [Sporichthya sp.]|nr:ATP-dependent DNA helicase [Sporichthya sp.]